MYKDKSFLAIIPARGGSKRLPRKNVLELIGKPLISWTIEAGKGSKYIDELIVSSDDDEILNIAKDNKSFLIKRPSKLASDTASSYAVVKHVIENIPQKYDYIILLQPTSPLRNSKHIDEAIELLKEKQADAIVSVCDMEHSPLWSNVLPKNLDMSSFISDKIRNKRSQDIETYYRLNGAIYICKIERFLEEKTFFLKDNIFAYVMDKQMSIDIDEVLDFEIASLIMKRKDKC